MSQDGEKRKERRSLQTVCPDCGTDVMHWIHFAAAGDIPTFDETIHVVDKSINRKIFVYDGSVTDLDCEVVVISANKKISMKEQGLVVKLAGDDIVHAARKQASEHGPLEEGDVIETRGFELPADHVLHVVIPTTFRAKLAFDLLKSCYENCLDHAKNKGFRSIAFSVLGSQSLRISKKNMAEAALGAIRDWLKDNKKHIDVIILCRFDNEDKDIYDEYLHRYFPVK